MVVGVDGCLSKTQVQTTVAAQHVNRSSWQGLVARLSLHAVWRMRVRVWSCGPMCRERRRPKKDHDPIVI